MLADVRFGSKADMCVATRDVRFTPDSDRESGFPQTVMSALPPKADMCGATRDVRFGPKADMSFTRPVSTLPDDRRPPCTIQHRRAVFIRPIRAEHWNEPGVRGRAASSCPIEKFGEFSDLYNFPSYDESLHNRSFTFAIKNRVPALLNGYFGLPH
jgi:hypothetical protein